MNRVPLLSLLFVLAAGCVTARPEVPHLSVYIQALPQGDQVARELRPDESLRSGDRFAPGVRLSGVAGGYVSVLLRSGKRAPMQIFPAAAPTPLSPEKDTLLTPGADFFHLDHEPGKEVVYVVYAAAPLDEAAARSAAVAMEAGAGKDRDPPPIIDRKDRGRIQVALRRDGPTVVRFPFEHK